MMIPFWSIAGTSDQLTVIEVDDSTVAVGSLGGDAGANKKQQI